MSKIKPTKIQLLNREKRFLGMIYPEGYGEFLGLAGII